MRRKRYVTPQDDRRRNGKVQATKADPGLWREALFLAGGDASRLQVEPDGTVTIRNAPVRPVARINSPFRTEEQ